MKKFLWNKWWIYALTVGWILNILIVLSDRPAVHTINYVVVIVDFFILLLNILFALNGQKKKEKKKNEMALLQDWDFIEAIHTLNDEFKDGKIEIGEWKKRLGWKDE
jgi:hypothetical protein